MLKTKKALYIHYSRIWIGIFLIVIILGSAGFSIAIGFNPRSMARAVKRAIYGTPTITPTPTPWPTLIPFPTWTPVPLVNEDAVLVGAGDIVTCGGDGSAMTAELIERFPGAAIFTAGDTSNNTGTPAQYHDCVSLTWGKFKDRIHPAPGNHDYMTYNAYGYFGYFGEAAGDPKGGYYSFNLGAWHVVMLNSECHDIGGCRVGSPQETWLKADLAAWPSKCSMAVMHKPLYVSGAPNNLQVRPLWQALYAAGAEIVISGHEHHYERFIPFDPKGKPDPARGIQEIIVATGGAILETPKGSPLANSVMIISEEYGIIKLTLHPTSYEWEFIPVEDGDEPGIKTDSGHRDCH
jgi:hypothetical protein